MSDGSPFNWKVQFAVPFRLRRDLAFSGTNIIVDLKSPGIGPNIAARITKLW
jgi:hypothetical protein